ncbi:hypothetical protein [Streptomyces sp. NPDC059862]|uniref:hypothetical protein n=1 Tax=unclassified Streptomyces TaxID=2593676 RepID=UPI00362C19D0
MTTPAGLISGDGDESQRALNTLSEARNAILTNLDNIDGQRGNLQTQFGGLDGSAYGRLLQDWLGHANAILNDLDHIIDTFGTNARMMSNQSAEAAEQVAAAAARNAMLGR